MTKSQCSNEIVRNQALIAQYESEIRGYQEQISELQETKTKLGVLQARLSDSKTASNTKLAETESLNKINSKIVSGFYAGMSDVFTGQQYQNVYGGLDNAKARVDVEISNIANKIVECQNKIATCMQKRQRGQKQQELPAQTQQKERQQREQQRKSDIEDTEEKQNGRNRIKN